MFEKTTGNKLLQWQVVEGR